MEKEDINFVFSFKNLNSKILNYYASYSSSGELKIKECRPNEHRPDDCMLRKLNKKEAWQSFYANATFDSILKAIKPHDTNLESPDNYLSPSDNQEFLEQMRDEPYYLSNPQALVHFAEMINEMKWNPATSKILRKAFLKYFIPKDIQFKNKKPIPPIKLHLELLKKIARHLSDKCKQKLKDLDAETEKDFKSDTYRKLILWASDNEPRICRVKPQGIQNMINSMKEQGKNKIPLEVLLRGYALNMKQLKELIFKPLEYASNRISAHLKISRPTIYRLLK